MCGSGSMLYNLYKIINHHNRMFDFSKGERKPFTLYEKANRFADDIYKIVTITIDDNE